ncbi:MAG: hypothetical protein V1847_01575 [Candidatus Diapherotrites archaeon]
MEKAIWAGQHLPSGFLLSVVHGDEPRHQSTANYVHAAYPGRKEPFTTATASALAPELGVQWLKNPKAYQKLVEEFGREAVIRKWIDGNVSPEVLERPEIVGKEILKKRLRETKVQIAFGYRPFHAAVSSAPYDAAMLKVLGIDYARVKPKTGAGREPKRGETFKETEAMLFYHLPDGRIILSWRGKKFDVSKKLDKLLSKP